MSGEKGTTERKLAYPGISMQLENQKLVLKSKKDSRNEKRILGTFAAHVANMVTGSSEGYTYKLKVCSGHFPMKVSVENNKVKISNFLGEKIPRTGKILEGVSVKIENDIITVEGIDKEKTGQTAANIERATRITNRDRRVFQDGCYIIQS